MFSPLVEGCSEKVTRVVKSMNDAIEIFIPRMGIDEDGMKVPCDMFLSCLGAGFQVGNLT